jgi:SAM-dependent methyltransferase
VLEIGCGDVPLGIDLAQELLALQTSTGKSARAIVRDILCTDYSETVVRHLQLQQQQQQPQPQQPPSCTTALTFRTMDARAMDLPDASFELILDKGTLDAMLSDPINGVQHCVAIVAECARVLTAPGCLVLVSHLNAHTPNGIQWLHEVVFAGLQRDEKTNRHAKFHVEVHGNDGVVEDEEEEESDQVGVTTKAATPPVDHTPSAGPAVYVIHKHSVDKDGATDANNSSNNTEKDDDNDDPEATVSIIPVRFFTYN